MRQVANLFQKAMNDLAQNIHCVMLGKILNYNMDENTADIEPLHTSLVTGEQYNTFVGVPLGFYSIGGYNIKVKPSIGDIVVLLFVDFDIDNIIIDGKTKTQNTERTHSVNDCLAIPISFNFLNNAFACTDDLTISKEGTGAYVKIKNNGNVVINGDKILLGENATVKIMLEDGESSTNVYAK